MSGPHTTGAAVWGPLVQQRISRRNSVDRAREATAKSRQGVSFLVFLLHFHDPSSPRGNHASRSPSKRDLHSATWRTEIEGTSSFPPALNYPKASAAAVRQLTSRFQTFRGSQAQEGPPHLQQPRASSQRELTRWRSLAWRVETRVVQRRKPAEPSTDRKRRRSLVPKGNRSLASRIDWRAAASVALVGMDEGPVMFLLQDPLITATVLDLGQIAVNLWQVEAEAVFFRRTG